MMDTRAAANPGLTYREALKHLPKAQAPKKRITPQMFEPVKAGDRVSVVLADGTFADAKVIGVGTNGRVDLSFEFPVGTGTEMTITSSPFDGTGTKPDHWCRTVAAEI